jgi:hypothetical protein
MATEQTPQTFDDAFAEALAADAKPTPTDTTGATAQDPIKGDKTADAADAAGDVGATSDGAAGAGAPAGEGEAAAAAVEAAAASATDTAAPAPAAAPAATEDAELTRLRAENAAFKALAEKTPVGGEAGGADKGTVSAGAPAAPPEPKWYQPNEDEVARLDAFKKDWPDIFEATQVVTKQAAYNVAEYVFAQLARVYNPTLEQFAELSHTIQEQLALSAIRGEHNDYDDVYDNVVAWVETLPAAFRRGAQEVMKSGTPQEVSELINTYKQSTGATGTNQAATGAAVAGRAGAGAPAGNSPAPNSTVLSAAAKKAAGKLQVVGSKRTTPVTAADASDFDGAWAEALRSG